MPPNLYDGEIYRRILKLRLDGGAVACGEGWTSRGEHDHVPATGFYVNHAVAAEGSGPVSCRLHFEFEFLLLLAREELMLVAACIVVDSSCIFN